MDEFSLKGLKGFACFAAMAVASFMFLPSPVISYILTAVAAAMFIKWHKDQASLSFNRLIFNDILGVWWKLFARLNLNNRLELLEIKENSVILNSTSPEWYCVDLTGTSSVEKYLSDASIEAIMSACEHVPSGLFHIAAYKKASYQKLYLFTPSEELAKQVSLYFEVPIVKGLQIAEALLDLTLQNRYFEHNKNIFRTLNLCDDMPRSAMDFCTVFNRLMRHINYTNMKKAKVFRAFRIKDMSFRETNYSALFKIDFEGTIWQSFDLSKSRRMSFAEAFWASRKMFGGKAGFEKIIEVFDRDKSQPILTSSVMYLLRGDKSTSISIGEVLGFNYIEQHFGAETAIVTTPIKRRDFHFILPATLDILNNRVASVHKRHTKSPDIYGTDLKGAFVNFSFSQENPAPHAIIIAETGSGKSFAKQKMIAQMVGLDAQTGYCDALGLGPGQYAVRNFDIGGSDLASYLKINSNPKNSCGRLSEEFEKFAFNIVNFELNELGEPLEEDINFASDLIGLYFESYTTNASAAGDYTALSLAEAGKFKQVCRDVYRTFALNQSPHKLKDIRQSHPEIYEEQIKLGLSGLDSLSRVEGYEYLKKPILIDVVQEVKIHAESLQQTEEERAIYRSLAAKLDALLQGAQAFCRFDNFKIDDAAFFYSEFNTIKETKEFVPMFFSIFWKIYIKDRKRALQLRDEGKARPKLIYAIEEASNYFRIPTFVTMFEKLALETRKYNIHLLFIIQNIEDVPPAIFNNLATRFFLTTPAKKANLEKVITQNLNPTPAFLRALRQSEMYTLTVWYSHGAFNLRLAYSDEESKLFSSNPNAV